MATGSGHDVAVDRRVVKAFAHGPDGADALVFHAGTPSPPVRWPFLEGAATERGFSLITYERPGYDGSDRRRGRQVADAARDVEAILDELGFDEYVTIGWSGGGPHALACAAQHPARCRAAATIGTLSPLHLADDTWWDAMSPPNEHAFRAAVTGEETLRGHLEPARKRFLAMTVDDLHRALGELVSETDRRALTPELADMLARARRQAAATGFDGWIDDLIAFVNPWGFDLAEIGQPVTIWHGEQDDFVPVGHGHRLESSIPGAIARILEHEGHISIVADRLPDVIDDLRRHLATDPTHP